MPRSGTTWVARSLAQSPRTAMLGREPMNPRPGQYGLGGRLESWVRLDGLDGGLRRTLLRVYRGHDPRTFGRFGVRQWRVLLPATCILVKDPFALLSVKAVTEATGATPVVVYRSAAETLSSYRRMGWRADSEEFASLGAPGRSADEVKDMAAFWSWGYSWALDDLASLRELGREFVVVSHADLTAGGPSAQSRLREQLGLGPVSSPAVPEASPERTPGVSPRVDQSRLHNLDRTAEEVIAGAQANVTPDESRRLAELTGVTWSRLELEKLAL